MDQLLNNNILTIVAKNKYIKRKKAVINTSINEKKTIIVKVKKYKHYKKKGYIKDKYWKLHLKLKKNKKPKKPR